MKLLSACLGYGLASLCLYGNALYGGTPPTLSSSLTPGPVCSRALFSYIPTSSTASASFSWTRAAVPGIGNPAGSGIGAVSDTLKNITGNAITVTYVFTVVAGTDSTTQDVQVVVEPAPQASFTVSQTTECLTGNSFTFTSTSTIGTGSIQKYYWYPGDGSSSSGVTDITHSYAAPGTYSATLICQSNNGCFGQAVVPVVVNPQPVAAFTYSLVAPYTNDSYFFSNHYGGASPMAAANWSFGDGGTATTLPSATHTYAGPGAETVSLTVTDQNGCSSTVSKTLNTPVVGSGGAAAFNVDNNGVCLGQTFNFTDNTQATSAETGWAWDFGDGRDTTVQNPSHFYTAPGYYTVKLTVAFANGSTSTVTQSLEVYPTPAVTLSPGTDQIVCSGGKSNPVYFQPATDGLNYAWSSNNPAVGIPTGGGQSLPSFQMDSVTTSEVTTITITPGSPYACPLAAKTFTISVNPLPVLTTNFPRLTVCSGSAVLEPAFTSSLPGTTYTWTNSNPVTGLGAAGTGDIPQFTALNYAPTPVTSYITYIPKAAGCTGIGAYTTYTVYPTPALVTPPVDTGICSGASFAYNPLTSLSGDQYTWKRAAMTGLAQPADSGTGAVSETLTNQTPGFLTVPYLFSLSTAQCANIDTVDVVLAPNLTLTPPLDTNICNGTTFNYTLTSPVSGATLSWTRGVTPGLSNPAATGGAGINELLNNTDTGAVKAPYVFTITAAGCTGNQTFTVAVNPIPTLSLGSTGQSLCPGVSALPVDWTVVPYGTGVQWTNDNANIGLGQFGTGTLPAFTAVDAGTVAIQGNIQATAVSAAGCKSATFSGYTYTVNPAPTATLDTPSGTWLCPGTGLPLQAGGGTTYLWSRNGQDLGGQTGASLSAADSGLYRVTAFTDKGCGDSAEVTVNMIPRPGAAFTFTTFCEDTPVVFQNNTPGTTVPVTYRWADNGGHSSTVEDPVFTYPQAGQYTVGLTVIPDGCNSQADSVQQKLTVAAPIPGSTLARQFVLPNKPSPLTAPGYSGASYDWIPGLGLSDNTVISPDVTLAEATAYTIRITQPSGCVTTDTLPVSLIAPDVVYIPTAFTPNGDGHNDLFVIAGLNNYPGSSLTVYNRWGNTVFNSPSYGNDWDGGTQPAGTYVYLLRLQLAPGSWEMKKGFLELVR